MPDQDHREDFVAIVSSLRFIMTFHVFKALTSTHVHNPNSLTARRLYTTATTFMCRFGIASLSSYGRFSFSGPSIISCFLYENGMGCSIHLSVSHYPQTYIVAPVFFPEIFISITHVGIVCYSVLFPSPCPRCLTSPIFHIHIFLPAAPNDPYLPTYLFLVMVIRVALPSFVVLPISPFFSNLAVRLGSELGVQIGRGRRVSVAGDCRIE